MLLMVFFAFPSIVALAIVLSICSLYFASVWGRSLATDSRSALVILGVGWLDWSRIPAWGVGNLGSNPSDPTRNTVRLRTPGEGYDTVPGDARWNPNADINGDGKVSLAGPVHNGKTLQPTLPIT